MLNALAGLYDPAPQPGVAARVINLVTAVVGADSCSYNAFAANGAVTGWRITPADVGAFPDGARLFAQHLPEHPVLSHQHRTGDGRARRISDFLTARQFRALGLYRDFYRPSGVAYQLAFTVPAADGGLIGVALNRSSRDFTDSDVAAADRLRSHIGQAHAIRALLESVLTTGPYADDDRPTLTARQRQILQLVADGLTDRTIGRFLGISTRTVQAHLQQAYRTLNATSRTEALARLRR